MQRGTRYISLLWVGKNRLYIWLHMFNFFFFKKSCMIGKKYVYSICKTVLSVFVSSHVNWKNIKSTALSCMAVVTYRRAEQFILFIWAILYFHLKADTLTLQSYWGFYILRKEKKMLPWRNILPYYTEVGRKFVLKQNLPLSERSRDAVLTPLGVSRYCLVYSILNCNLVCKRDGDACK